MSKAISVPLPAALQDESIDEWSLSMVKDLISKHGGRYERLPEEVQEKIIPTLKQEARGFAQNHYNIYWDNEEATARLIINDDVYNNATEDELQELGENAVDDLMAALEAAAFFVAGGAVTLSSLPPDNS